MQIFSCLKLEKKKLSFATQFLISSHGKNSVTNKSTSKYEDKFTVA